MNGGFHPGTRTRNYKERADAYFTGHCPQHTLRWNHINPKKERPTPTKRERPIWIARAITTYLLLWLPCTVVASPNYSAKGRVQYQIFGNVTNEILFKAIVGFELDVDGCQWAVRAETIPDNGHGEELAYDGTNTYRVIASTASSLTNFPAVAGFIKKENVPFHSGVRADCVWLALASHCYLDKEQSGFLSPAWIAVNRTESSLAGDRFRASIMRLEGEPRLPQSVECWTDGFIFNNRGPKKTVAPPPFNTGYLCFRYETRATTNHAGSVIPQRSMISFYDRRPGATDVKDVRKAMDVEIFVESVASPCLRTNWQPALGFPTRIEDFRFLSHKEGTRLYDTPGPFWPSERDVTSMNNFARSGNYEDDIKRRSIRKYVVGVTLVVTIIFSALLYRLRQSAC